MRRLTVAELNHLRRLLSYVDCEIGESPDEFIDTLKNIVPSLNGVVIKDEAKLRLAEHLRKSAAVPRYVRSAVKALRKTIRDQEGQVLDAVPTRSIARRSAP